MADTKRRLEIFAVYDVNGMARHYEKMAAKGWLIDSAGGFLPRYRKTEPQKLKFAVVYLNKASDYARPSDEHNEFYDMCLRRGWYLVTKTGEMHIFANSSENPDDIETDGAIQMENLHRSKGRYLLWSYAFLALLQLVNMNNGLKSFYRWPSIFFVGGGYTSVLLHLCTFLFFVSPVVDYLLWYIPAAIKARREDVFYSRRTSLFIKVSETAGMILMLYVPSGFYNLWFFAVLFSGVLVAGLANNILIKIMGTEKGSGKEMEAYAGIMVALIIIAWTWIGYEVLTAAQISVYGYESRSVREETWTYEHGGSYTEYIYADNIPLKLEDIAGTAAEGYSYKGQTYADSPLIKMYSGSQTADKARKLPEIYYYVYETENAHIYDSIVQRYLKNYGGKPYRTEILSAEKIYVSGWRNSWLLCYPDRVIEFDINMKITDSDLKIAEEKLLDFEI